MFLNRTDFTTCNAQLHGLDDGDERIDDHDHARHAERGRDDRRRGGGHDVDAGEHGVGPGRERLLDGDPHRGGPARSRLLDARGLPPPVGILALAFGGEPGVGLFFLGEVQPQDRMQSVHHPAEVHEVVLAGPDRGQVVDE